MKHTMKKSIQVSRGVQDLPMVSVVPLEEIWEQKSLPTEH